MSTTYGSVSNLDEMLRGVCCFSTSESMNFLSLLKKARPF